MRYIKEFQIVLTDKCNLKCKYCYINQLDNSLSYSQIDEYIENIKEYNNFYTITYFGGEPLLEFDKIKYITEKLKDDINNQGLEIYSNGLLLTQDIVDYIKNNNINFNLSMDGIYNDFIRIGSTIKQYKNKISLIKQLTSIVNVMISPENINFIENTQFLYNEFLLYPKFILIRDDIWNDKDVKNFKKEFKKFSNYIYDLYILNKHAPDNLIKYHLKLILSNLLKKETPLQCPVISNKITALTPTGIKDCARFYTNEIKYNPEMLLYLNKCNNCEIKDFCPKGCMFSIFLNKGPVNNLCEIYKIIINEIITLNNKLKNNKRWQQLILTGMDNAK